MALRRHKYSMHHTWTTGVRIGEVIPVFHQEVLPGDQWRGRQIVLFRLAPLDKPCFAALQAQVNFFLCAPPFGVG